jgi:hypothetical protein
MLRVEFHCHTLYSKDSLLRPADLVRACQRKNLARVVVTDHNTIRGALLAQEIDPHRVIVGEEVMTTQGELLAAFVREELPAGLSPLEAIQRLREQGAFISVSHPRDRQRGWELHELEQILPLVDAIEVFNSRCIFPEDNTLAQELAQRHNLLATVGSDAHTAFELGRSTLLLPEFYDTATLKAALREAQSQTMLSSPGVHFTSRWAVWYKTWHGNSLENPALLDKA